MCQADSLKLPRKCGEVAAPSGLTLILSASCSSSLFPLVAGTGFEALGAAAAELDFGRVLAGDGADAAGAAAGMCTAGGFAFAGTCGIPAVLSWSAHVTRRKMLALGMGFAMPISRPSVMAGKGVVAGLAVISPV